MLLPPLPQLVPGQLTRQPADKLRLLLEHGVNGWTSVHDGLVSHAGGLQWCTLQQLLLKHVFQPAAHNAPIHCKLCCQSVLTPAPVTKFLELLLLLPLLLLQVLLWVFMCRAKARHTHS